MPTVIPYNGHTQIARIKIRRNVLVSKVIVKDHQAFDVPVESPEKAKVVSSNNTIVREVMVGKPVRRAVATSGVAITGISGIDVSMGREDGDVLVYSANTTNFEATRYLEKQFINGGQY